MNQVDKNKLRERSIELECQLMDSMTDQELVQRRKELEEVILDTTRRMMEYDSEIQDRFHKNQMKSENF